MEVKRATRQKTKIFAGHIKMAVRHLLFFCFVTAMYIVLGLSAIVPAVHFIAIYGLKRGFYEASFGWLLLMAALYISGACLYALRIPERFFPGKFDIWVRTNLFYFGHV